MFVSSYIHLYPIYSCVHIQSNFLLRASSRNSMNNIRVNGRGIILLVHVQIRMCVFLCVCMCEREKTDRDEKYGRRTIEKKERKKNERRNDVANRYAARGTAGPTLSLPRN